VDIRPQNSRIAAASPTDSVAAKKTRADAAKAFESELLRQFVETMMSGVFESKLGNNETTLLQAGTDTRKEVLVDQVSKFLAERGGLGLADRILQQWTERFGEDVAPEELPDTPLPTSRPIP
jgi:Rod binding domain-containing protein